MLLYLHVRCNIIQAFMTLLQLCLAAPSNANSAFGYTVFTSLPRVLDKLEPSNKSRSYHAFDQNYSPLIHSDCINR